MEAASSKRSEEIQRTAGGLVLENTNGSAPEKTSSSFYSTNPNVMLLS
jgi:hypothetical protein